jgi:hypothetical protein
MEPETDQHVSRSATNSLGAGSRTALRAGAAGGIGFVGLFLAGSLLSSTGFPNDDPTPEQMLEYLSQHNGSIEFGALVLIPASGLALLVFLSGLRLLLQRGSTAESAAGTVALGAGLVYLTITIIAAAMGATASASLEFFERFKDPQAISAYLTASIGFEVAAVGAWFAAVMIFAATLAGRRATVLPPWVSILGFVLAVLALTAGVFGFGFPLVGLWVAVISGVLWRSADTVTA